METAYHYEVKVNWEADRKGSMSSPVLNTKIEVATPPEFPKGMPGIWSPEHLLVAATLEKVDGKFMMSEVILSPVLTIAPDADKEKALRILEKSEAACLISNSVKAKIVFKPEIKITELVEPV